MALPDPPDPFLGEIRLFAGGFEPKEWAICNGRLLTITGNEALFSLFGTTYGGDGNNTFGIPDLRGRVPVTQGMGMQLGEMGGKETVSLDLSELAHHTHTANCTSETGEEDPTNKFWGYSGANPYATTGGPLVLNNNSLASVGLGEPHENRVPYVAINYIISLKGAYPSH